MTLSSRWWWVVGGGDGVKLSSWKTNFCYVRLSWGRDNSRIFKKWWVKKIWVKKYFDQIKFWAWHFLWLKKVGQKKNCITQTLYKSFQSQIIMKFTNILRTNSHWNFYQKFIWEKLNKNIPFSNLFDFKW